MEITKTTRSVKPTGVVKGIIHVADGKKKYRVKYIRESNGHTEQWGAPTEVLCFTYNTFERLASYSADRQS